MLMKFIKIDNDIYNVRNILKFKFKNNKLYLDKEEYDCTEDEFETLTSFLRDNNRFFKDIRHTDKEISEQYKNMLGKLNNRH